LMANNFDGKSSLEYLFKKIRNNRNGAPIFAYSTLLHPHTPYYPPQKFLDLVFQGRKIVKTAYDIQLNLHAYVNGDFGEAHDAMESVKMCYKADLLYADHLVGEFINRLKKEGLFDNTLLIILADHGELLGEHGDINHGGTVWEELLSIPCLIYYPEKIASNSTISKLTTSLDILPTILDLIEELENVKSEFVLDGTSIFDKQMDWGKRYLVVDSPPAVFPGRLKKYPHALYKLSIIRRALRTSKYKYIWQSNGEKYLFPVGEAEVTENNLYQKYEKLAKRFHKQMVAYYKSIDSKFKIDEYPLEISRMATRIARNPEVREELKKLGYIN